MLKPLTLILIISMGGEAIAAPLAGTSCQQPVYALQAGQPSPCEGFLFSPDKEKELRLEDQDYKLLKDEADLKDKQLQLYKAEVEDYQTAIQKEKEEVKIWQQSAEDATEKYVKQEERSGTRDLIFTVLGVLLTVGAGYALHQAARK